MPQKELFNSYHKNLKEIFRGGKLINIWFEKIFQNLFLRPSIAIRLAEITIILILGIFIGKSINKTKITHPVIEEDIVTKFLNNYLFETELLLLEISNIDNELSPKFIMHNKNCNLLLQKTIFLKEQAIETNDIGYRLTIFEDEHVRNRHYSIFTGN